MWQRFTERARRVVFTAQQEAARLGENLVSTEHLLLGLLNQEDSLAARILIRMNIDMETIRAAVLRQAMPGEGKPNADMQLTQRARRVIDLSYDEARRLSNNYIGTEHLLLGMLREGEGLAAGVLREAGADLEITRAEIRQVQSEATQSSGTADTTAVPKVLDARPLAKRTTSEFHDFSIPDEGTENSGPGRGDIGVLSNEDGRKVVEFVPEAGSLPAFAEVMRLKDEFAYRELIAEGKVMLLPAGTGAKFLRQEMPGIYCVRILEGDSAGRIGFVLRKQLRDTRKDDRPFPPDIS